MKRIILPVLAYLVCMLPVLCHKAPKGMQVLTSGIEFRTLTFGQVYVPEEAENGVQLTDSLVYVCPATGSDPFTLAALQTLLAREVVGFTARVTPANFGQMAQSHFQRYVRQYENAAYAMRQSENDKPLYMNYARYITTRLDYSSPRALVMEMRRDEYTGGAHGNYEIRRMSIRLGGVHTQVLQPKDIFTPDLDSVAVLGWVKEALMADNGCATAEELAHKTCIDLDEVFLTSNVSIDPRGVTFIYQPYEIACYAGGAPRVTLPMERMRPWLKPDIAALFSDLQESR